MGAIASQITSLTIVYSTVHSGADQRKLQSSASLAFVRGNHRWPVNSRHKWPVTQKMFSFGDVIMYLSVINLIKFNQKEPLVSCKFVRYKQSALFVVYFHGNMMWFPDLFSARIIGGVHVDALFWCKDAVSCTCRCTRQVPGVRDGFIPAWAWDSFLPTSQWTSDVTIDPM